LLLPPCVAPHACHVSGGGALYPVERRGCHDGDASNVLPAPVDSAAATTGGGSGGASSRSADCRQRWRDFARRWRRPLLQRRTSQLWQKQRRWRSPKP